MARQKSQQKLFKIVVILKSGKECEVNISASSQEVAERRALKRTPTAVAVRPNP